MPLATHHTPKTPPGLNRPPADLPTHCDVIVVGAGPAGSAAAITLARAGFDVVLVDQQAFPRDKVCGDGLIPDAHHALRRLGLLDAVLARARVVKHVGVIGPRGGRIDVPGTLAVLPRRELDLLLCTAAVEAGARMFAPVRFVGVLEDDPTGTPRVVGAQLRCGDAMHELRAPWVLIASGAPPQALLAAGMCERRTPTGVAMRGYVKNPAMVGRITELEVVWHPRMKRGYGWVFPCPDGVFNIGVGVAHSHKAGHDSGRTMQDVNLRKMFDEFTRVHAPARELLADGTWVGELKGAPLRCSLAGAKLSRPGLLVTGEAAGSTYAFTGEGIGKALETGLAAADMMIEGRHRDWPEAQVRASYEARVRALKPRYEMYDKANIVNAHPWLVELVVWSARRSPSRLRRMTGLLEETHLPSSLLTVKSWMRMLFVHT
ncbi:MAG: geranylgeranyl reductase family protein [Burkholderiaceae bacterium]|nr:geranylgeranyl reductase family protein [Burkholderiaceae bacterium]